MVEMKSYAEDLRAIAQEPLPWAQIAGKSVLVAGATGLVGAALVEALLALPVPVEVYAAGRNAERAAAWFAAYADNPRFHFVQMDVCRPIQGAQPFDYILDAASSANPKSFATQPVEVMLSNFEGVRNLLDYGLLHGMQRFLYVSTGEIYGEGAGNFSEHDSGYVDCATPRACYPSAKRAAETLCVAYAAEHQADVVIARLCHVYGPRFTEHDNRVYAQFLRNIAAGNDLVLKSSGQQLRSWCYVVDAVRALLYVLLKGECAAAYNVADPNSVFTIRQLADTLAALGGKRVVMAKASATEKQGGTPITLATFNTEKLQSLGFTIEGTWQEKLQKTLEAYIH